MKKILLVLFLLMFCSTAFAGPYELKGQIVSSVGQADYIWKNPCVKFEVPVLGEFVDLMDNQYKSKLSSADKELYDNYRQEGWDEIKRVVKLAKSRNEPLDNEKFCREYEAVVKQIYQNVSEFMAAQ